MYLLTHSLLSSWLWSMEDVERDTMSEFVRTLKRERTEPTPAMLKGREFEKDVCDCILHPDKYSFPITDIASAVRGARQQVKVSYPATIGGVDYLLYGVMDFVRGGIVFDTKFSASYTVGKYLNSTQHPMYFRLLTEATRFVYLISNGRVAYAEEYFPDKTPPIDQTIRDFAGWLRDRPELEAIYRDKWVAR